MTLEADAKLYFIAILEIRGVQPTDKGEYRAIASNKHGEGVATINLNFDNAAGGAPKWDTFHLKLNCFYVALSVACNLCDFLNIKKFIF